MRRASSSRYREIAINRRRKKEAPRKRFKNEGEGHLKN